MRQHIFSRQKTTLHLVAAGQSDKGLVRPNNEDALALCEPSQEQATRLGRLYLLADGAGGHAAGEVASKSAIETIARIYYQQGSPAVHTSPQNSACHASTLERLLQAFLAADTRLRELAALRPDYAGMATTCVAAVVKDTRLTIAYIGDSRAYLVHRPSSSSPTMTRLTTDHSLVNALVKAGAITPEQAPVSPARHILLRMLGGSEEHNAQPDLVMRDVRAGESLVLCCDGLWSTIKEERIAEVVSQSSPQAACAELVRLANAAGGEDNVSVMIIAFT